MTKVSVAINDKGARIGETHQTDSRQQNRRQENS